MGLLKERIFAAAVFLVGAVLLFLTAPHHGEFWWSDAPRHALNGAFIKDLIATMPAHPAAWAMQYYVKYPALTILFYPPLFYVILAPFYALFGVSHATAIGVELLHYFALAFGLYVLSRRWVSPLVAIGVGLSVMAAPGIALWGRQVMLEVPSVAFAIWAAVALESYLGDGRAPRLYLAAFLLLCATYTKITTIFLFPVFALVLLVAEGPKVLRERRTWLVVALTIIGLIPVVLLTIKFGGANVQSVTGIPDAAVSRDSIAGWIWYARQMPWQLGWPLLALAVLAVPLAVAGRLSPRLTRADLTLIGGWIVLGYLFLSAIDLKEGRHALVFLPLVLVAAGLSIDALLASLIAGPALLALVIGTGVYTWRDAPTPFVDGYREAAEWIAHAAPKDAVVVFSGKRDGSFIFNMRSIKARPDISIRAIRQAAAGCRGAAHAGGAAEGPDRAADWRSAGSRWRQLRCGAGRLLDRFAGDGAVPGGVALLALPAGRANPGGVERVHRGQEFDDLSQCGRRSIWAAYGGSAFADYRRDREGHDRQVTVRQCAVLVGGLGTRLGDLTTHTPKPLLPCGDRPFLAWLLRELVRFGVDEFVLLAGYRADAVRAAVPSLSGWLPRAARIIVAEEPVRAGTGGALHHARALLDQRFLLCNGDTLFDCNLAPLLSEDVGIGRMLLCRLEDASRYGVVTLDGDRVTGFSERSASGAQGIINTGVYLFDRGLIDDLSPVCSLEADILPRLAARGALRGTVGEGYFRDIGVPEDLPVRSQEDSARVAPAGAVP